MTTNPADDPTGTVRRSPMGRIVVAVADTDRDDPNDTAQFPHGWRWAALDRRDYHLANGDVALWPVIGTVPGTPAAEASEVGPGPDLLDAVAGRLVNRFGDVLTISRGDVMAQARELAADLLAPVHPVLTRLTFQRDTAHADAEAKLARLTPDDAAHQCQDGWIEDANWSPENAEEQRAGRRPGNGLLECPTCAEPTTDPAPAAIGYLIVGPSDEDARAGRASTPADFDPGGWDGVVHTTVEDGQRALASCHAHGYVEGWRLYALTEVPAAPHTATAEHEEVSRG
ncbi:hypothetical protein [Saccharothrix sp. HUAS TT1]|uniref:hypothetical protein n=1 Tax=unclassified Saccharothrix TaxID=2593673 RepID=UPI00345B96CE